MKIRLVPGHDTDEVTIKVSGSCESPDARHLRDVVEQVLDSGFRAIALDISEVTYLSKHCLASLTALGEARRTTESNCCFGDLSPTCGARHDRTVSSITASRAHVVHAQSQTCTRPRSAGEGGQP